jgi:transcriptional regulator with XRE-family HTH domain
MLFQMRSVDRREYEYSARIGKALKEVRESLRLSQEDVAKQLRVNRITISRCEAGAQVPGTGATYQWCQALGLVLPQRTALVRVVDLSPALLRFLEEDPERLRSLGPDQFETFVADRLDRMGYDVALTGAITMRDGGVDLFAVPKAANLGSVVVAAQIKHHRGNQKSGREDVDRLLSWKGSAFGIGLLVTNTAFTRDAIWTAHKEANASFLRLRDLDDLKRWLEGRYGDERDWREIPQRIELAPGVVIEVPRPNIVSKLEV